MGQAAKSQKAYWSQEDLGVNTKDFKKEVTTSNLNIHWMVFLTLIGKVYFSLLTCFVYILWTKILLLSESPRQDATYLAL